MKILSGMCMNGAWTIYMIFSLQCIIKVSDKGITLQKTKIMASPFLYHFHKCCRSNQNANTASANLFSHASKLHYWDHSAWSCNGCLTRFYINSRCMRIQVQLSGAEIKVFNNIFHHSTCCWIINLDDCKSAINHLWEESDVDEIGSRKSVDIVSSVITYFM